MFHYVHVVKSSKAKGKVKVKGGAWSTVSQVVIQERRTKETSRRELHTRGGEKRIPRSPHLASLLFLSVSPLPPLPSAFHHFYLLLLLDWCAERTRNEEFSILSQSVFRRLW